MRETASIMSSEKQTFLLRLKCVRVASVTPTLSQKEREEKLSLPSASGGAARAIPPAYA